ncbi:iron-siderophore ABC transporter substrate-binding protein [Bogoriella caseilytica]|uniref:Iron complex transport system substrate-binding protein n=1 Tax=Bogoriella caseilytica TaxID=56055 RepID=A0A3N2BDV3_9MICO|nr:iron-siderophore ABC transporter substrate-binding protein [Bogoriella caseilytica]ROR73422.1 iron complex transport system substrate-binding protein [Bogoriella caseilytica]
MTTLHSTSRLAALGGAALLALSACSASTASEPAPEAPAAEEAPESSAFPVTIEHEFGETVIEAEPERIVAIGWGDLDNLLALDVPPVGYFGALSEGLLPWAADQIDGSEPEFLGYTTEVDYEQIAALEPDLIIAVQGTAVDDESYRLLDEIAPTVARPAGMGGWQVGREDGTRQIAAALGRADEGEELLRELSAQFEAARQAYPALEGATGVSVITYDASLYYAFAPIDGRGAFLEDLGLEWPEAVRDQYDGTTFSVELSPEEVGILDGDVVLFMVDEPEYDPIADNGLFERFDADLIAVTAETRTAISLNTPLSTAYAIEHLTPVIAEALDD